MFALAENIIELAGLLVVLHDDRMEESPYDEPTDLVAISIEIYAARRAYEIAAEYRARGVPVILGGPHPTLFPEECSQYADSIYLGDAEFRWAEVVDDARHRRLKPVYHAQVGVAQPGGVQPRRDLFQGKGYLPLTLLQFSRGCRFACEFCAVSAYFKKTQYIRPTKEVLDTVVSLADEGMTMLCVTHEMGFARRVANRVVFMDSGEIVEVSEPWTFFSNPQHQRTRRFLRQILH